MINSVVHHDICNGIEALVVGWFLFIAMICMDSIVWFLSEENWIFFPARVKYTAILFDWSDCEKIMSKIHPKVE